MMQPGGAPQGNPDQPMFMIMVNGMHYGPFPLAHLEQEIANQRLFFTMSVLDRASNIWVPAMQIPALAELFNKYQEVQLLEMQTIGLSPRTVILTNRKLVIIPGKMEKRADGFLKALSLKQSQPGGSQPMLLAPNLVQRVQVDDDSNRKGEHTVVTFFHPGLVGMATTEVSLAKANADLLVETLQKQDNWNFEFVDQRGRSSGVPQPGAVQPSPQTQVVQHIHYGDVITGDKSSAVNIQDSVVTGSQVGQTGQQNFQDQAVMENQMTCPQCGGMVQAGWKLCPNCEYRFG